LRGLSTTARSTIAPVTARIALRADQLRMHDDPADRLIVATTLQGRNTRHQGHCNPSNQARPDRVVTWTVFVFSCFTWAPSQCPA
jgi:hypothetical protein